MATDPAFAATPNVGVALLGAAETNLQVPTQASTVITAGANGAKVEEITIEATTTSLTPTTVSGLVYIFLHDGTTAHLYDVLAVGAVTASTTTAPFRISQRYTNMFLKGGWTLRAAQSIAGNASLLKCHVVAGDF